MSELQEIHHGAGHDYERGSPHLRHPVLRNEIVGRIGSLIRAQFVRSGACRVLEIGAGHGGFTDSIAATGASVTVTEMSRSSLDRIQERLAWNRAVDFLYDPDGEAVFQADRQYDLILCISVLHHIPDYLAYMQRLVTLVAEGGAIATFQDPLWYPRRSALSRYVNWGSFYLWRIGQGNLKHGMRTFSRRIRRLYDESQAEDMVEYHVIRSGIDERRLEKLLLPSFRSVETWQYWSTQSALLQAVGSRLGIETYFGMTAIDRVVSTS